MPTSLDLRDLLGADAGGAPSGVTVTGLCTDSRKLQKGDLFFALNGSRADGRQYILDAANRGAAAIVGALASATGAAADPAPPFKDLLTQAQANAPRLAEAAAGVRQAEGLARQAGARPNPTAGVTVENFSGKGIYSGTNNAETTFQLSQPLEVGGKRDARVAAGRAALDAARARLVQSKADFAFALADAYALAEAADLRWDERVLDVAAGNGNASLAAARRGCAVTSTDYVPALLELGRQRAAAEQLDIAFQVADAEALPFADASFDAVLSTFGVMFTPDHARAAGEMLRVCRPGGRIALANWSPEGFIGQMFKVLGRHLPPPAGLQPPSLWGTLPHLQELFGDRATTIEVTPRMFNFRYRSPAHFIEVFRTWYGPVQKAFDALPADQGAELARDLAALLARMDIGTGDGCHRSDGDRLRW